MTFKFKTKKSYMRVWNALNDTCWDFSSYDILSITVYDEKHSNELIKVLDDNNIKYDVIGRN